MMNDFTKEELESIISTIKSLRIYTDIENWDEELADKIQSLIDNYCDHEYINVPTHGNNAKILLTGDEHLDSRDFDPYALPHKINKFCKHCKRLINE